MNIFKIALAGTALVGSLTSVMANNTCSFSGFYAGAQVGVGTMNGRSDFKVESRRAANADAYDTGNTSTRLAGTSAIGGLHVGYGKHFPNRFYLGFEAFANLSKNRANSKHSTTDYQAVFAQNNVNNPNNLRGYTKETFEIKVERKNSFGLALRPGMVFGNTLVNLILGMESTKFRYSANSKTDTNVVQVVQGNAVNQLTTVSNLDAKKSKRRYGFVPGLEVSFHANDHVVLGLRATHTIYRKAKLELNNNLNKANRNIRVQATDVMAKISYKF